MKKTFMRRVNNLTDRQVLYLLVVVVLVTSGWSAVLNLTSGQPDFQAWGEGWLQNFSTEMTGAISTFWLFSLVIGNRQDKKRLIIQMRSRDPATALNAVDELRENGWLFDGSLQDEHFVDAKLQGARLDGTNLQGASFWFANLEGAVMERANLQGATLSSARLQGAYLTNANLQGAILSGAHLEGVKLRETNLQNATLNSVNLQGANLRVANLRDADLRVANLRGADLKESNLQGTNLLDADFDETTTLPDGTQWTPDTDMTRFTDPNHPDFWRSVFKGSPAYRSDSS